MVLSSMDINVKNTLHTLHTYADEQINRRSREDNVLEDMIRGFDNGNEY